MEIKEIQIYAHSRDCNDFCFLDENENSIRQTVGYCPTIENFSGGDDLSFIIDNETGRILNWKPIKINDLDEICKSV